MGSRKNSPESEANPLPKHGSNKRVLIWQVDQNVDHATTQMDRDLKSKIENMGWHPDILFKQVIKKFEEDLQRVRVKNTASGYKSGKAIS